MLRNQALAPASRANKREGGALRDPEVRGDIGCEAHRFASSRYTEGRFFAARGAIGFESHGRAGGHYAEGRFFAARETIGSKPHGCANSRYAEGRFFVANNKWATLNAGNPGACPG